MNVASNTMHPSSEQIKNLFRNLRLCAPAWIDLPLDGIKEAAAMAEKYVERYPQLFWNTPDRREATDAAFVSNTLNRLKRSGLKTGRHALELIVFLEKKNA